MCVRACVRLSGTPRARQGKNYKHSKASGRRAAASSARIEQRESANLVRKRVQRSRSRTHPPPLNPRSRTPPGRGRNSTTSGCSVRRVQGWVCQNGQNCVTFGPQRPPDSAVEAKAQPRKHWHAGASTAGAQPTDLLSSRSERPPPLSTSATSGRRSSPSPAPSRTGSTYMWLLLSLPRSV